MEKPIRFSKIVLKSVIQEGKLELPEKFVRKYGSALTSPVSLTVPSSGSVWMVDLLKANGQVWFGNGWEQFASCYSLAHGHMLLFEYLGRSRFQVFIFDKTATEIEYPHVSFGASNPKSACEFREIETGGGEDDRPISRKAKNKSNSSCPPPRKKMIIGSTSKAPEASPSCSLRAPIPSPHGTNQQERPSCLRGLSAPERSKPRAFRPKNPFFMIAVTEAILKQHCYKLNVPTSFSKKCFKEYTGEVMLEVVDGINCRVCCRRANKGGVKLSSGWKLFVEQNCLELGDVCYFEWIKGRNVKLLVTIVRAS